MPGRTHKIAIDADVLAEIEEFKRNNALRPAGPARAPWSARQDALLLELWPSYAHDKVAKLVGYSINTCTRRFKELTEA